jgi:hypothetical protein
VTTVLMVDVPRDWLWTVRAVPRLVTDAVGVAGLAGSPSFAAMNWVSRGWGDGAG